MRTSSAVAEARVRAPIDEVFAVVSTADPAAWYPRFGPLPAVIRVTERTAPFDRLGATRRLHLSDGGHVREEVTVVQAPTEHSYRLTGFEKLFGRLVESALAEWTFHDEAPDATRIRWTYSFTARRGRGALVALIVALAWRPYMRRVLPPLARSAGPLSE